MSTHAELDLMSVPLDGTILIEASAGTGKTFSITSLVLRLIIERNLPIQQILVVTFTEAAVSELKERMRKKLLDGIEAFSRGKSNERFLDDLLSRFPYPNLALRRLKYAMINYDQAPVFTIHAFCRKVLVEHAFASGVFFETELTTSQDELLREITFDFWRENFYGESPLFFDYVWGSGFKPAKFQDLITRHFYLPWLRVIPQEPMLATDELEADFLRQFKELQKTWQDSREEVSELLTNTTSLYQRVYPKDKIPLWLNNMESYLANEWVSTHLVDGFEKFTRSAMEKSVKKGGQVPKHIFFDKCEELMICRQNLQQAYERRLTSLLVRYVRYVRKELTRRKQQKEIMFFDDLLTLLHEALLGPGGDRLGRVVRAKYRSALIDEFQDTDSVQYAIFASIFKNPHSALFLIGDPKQAIYGFRGADVFTYLSASREVSDRFTLSENWRTTPALIDAVNVIFRNVHSPFFYKDISFFPAKAAKDKEHHNLIVDQKHHEPLQLWFFRSDRFGVDGKPITGKLASELIPQSVASEISRLIALGRENRAVINGRPVTEGDIAVLVRRNSEALQIKRALAKAGIHAVLYNLGNLFETQESQEVERILLAIANPGNEIFLKAALVTDLIGLSAKELDELSKDQSEWDRWLVEFGNCHEIWIRYGFFRMFRYFLKRTGVLVRIMELEDGERRCTNVLHLSEVLHQVSLAHNLNPLSLLKWLSTQRDENSSRLEEYELRLESDENAVKIITIHRSKGLEFPIVFCPFGWHGSRVNRKKRSILFHDKTDDFKLTLDLGSDRWDEHLKLAEEEQLAENLRLLYVALTRAKQCCYLVWGRFNGGETSAIAYLLHPSIAGNVSTSEAQTVGSEKKFEDDTLWNDLLKIQERSHGSISVTTPPVKPTMTVLPFQEIPVLSGARTFGGRINTDWRISSFSSLVLNLPEEEMGADRDEAALPVNPSDIVLDETLDDTPCLDMFSFPRGSASGVFFHEVLEEANLAEADQKEMLDLVSAKLVEHNIDLSWAEPVCQMLRKIAKVSIPSEFGSFTLADVRPDERLCELEFYFPLKKLSAADMKEVFASCVVGRARSGAALGRIEELDFHPLQGFMKGFIDLVFRHNDRFYIVDWKSNFLGPTFENYQYESLQRTILDNWYHLQYYLYTLALHRYLSARLPEYRYESHFGEVFYLFLRGIDPEHSGCGIYRDRPSAETIEKLQAILIAG